MTRPTDLRHLPDLPHLPYRLDGSERGALREALRRNPLVHLVAPGLSADDIAALAAELGHTEAEPDARAEFRLAGFPQIMVMGNRRDAAGRIAGARADDHGFHSDRSFRNHPPEFTLLYAVEVPTRGGDTEYTSLVRVHDELDEATRTAWRSLDVEHEARSRRFDRDPDRCSVHPLVRRHPDSGRSLVFASPAYTRRVLGVSDSESCAILRRVAEALEPPDLSHRWRPGDLLAWDNRAVVHRATPYDDRERRELWRISVSLPAREGAPAQ
jgi:taurine dioxygenase